MLGFFYNAVIIPLRASFTQVQGPEYEPAGQLKGPPSVVALWRLLLCVCLDVFFDVVYLLDVFLVQLRVSVPVKQKEKDNKMSINDLQNVRIILLIILCHVKCGLYIVYNDCMMLLIVYHSGVSLLYIILLVHVSLFSCAFNL